jgi:streptogrisin C
MRPNAPARLACLLTSAVVVLAGLAVPASAAPAGGSAALDPAAEFLMRAYRLTPAEANARIANQDRVTALQDDLDAAFGESYGGMWIDQLAGGRVVIGVRPGQESTVRALGARRAVDRLRVVPVERTIAQLRAIQAQVRTATAGSLDGVEVGGLHLPTNTVTVHVDAAAPAARTAGPTAALRRALPGRLRFEPVEGVIGTAACNVPSENNVWCDAPLRGGVGITGQGEACSAGFNVRSVSDGIRYLLTAGHCDSGGGAWWQTRFANTDIHDIGPTHNLAWRAEGDALIIRLVNPGPDGWNPKPWVFVTGGGGTIRDEAYYITTSGATTVGLSVCMTGRIDGTVCGEVISRDTYGERVFHVAEVKGGCIRGGDSGGPVFRNHIAYGIVHGGRFPDGDKTQCARTWLYQGIRGALELMRVRLVTTSDP